MTKQNITRSTRKRVLSFLLAVVAIFALIPTISASAASFPDALRVGIIADGDMVTYSSNILGKTVTLRDIPVTYSDGSPAHYGLCFQEGAKLTGYSPTGYHWATDGSTGSSEIGAAAPFLAFFYDGIVNGDPGTGVPWSEWQREAVMGWVQVALWAAQKGAFTDYDDSAQLLKLAQERTNVYSVLFASEPSRVPSAESSMELLTSIVSRYKAGTFGTLSTRVYAYDDTGAGMQPILVGYLDKINSHPVYVKLSKTVEGESGHHAGAVFGVFADSACTDERGVITTTSSQWSVSTEILLTTPAATLYVKEISSGDPSLGVNPGVFAVAVDTATNGTAATAAIVVGDGSDGSVVNPKIVLPSGGIVQKVDAANGGGLPGATFRFLGNAEGGGFIDMNATTDSTGIIELQWLDASAPNYIAPGEYTVTEEIAPAGYEKSDDARHLRLWVEVIDGNRIQRSSGVLVFENFRKHSLTLRKTSDGSMSVAGAVFDLYRNGTKLGSYTTGSGGTVSLSVVDSGYYEFVETTAPTGMVLPFIPRVGVYIDAKDTSITAHQVSMKNFEYPEIVILKQSKTTNLPLAGAKFEVKIDATTLGTFVTNSTGRIVIGYEQYGAFLNGSASSWTVTVTEITAPDGYFDPEVKVQTNELRKGQSLSPFVYKNQPFPDVTVLKTDAKTAAPLAGAVFTLTGVDNANSFVAVSQADGIARFERVPVGTYELRETVAPEGYLLTDEVKTVVVREDGAAELSFEFSNRKKPTLTLTKYDYETAMPLPNAEFSISHKGGAVVHEGITNAAGQIILEDLEPGWYTITELAPPPGYLIMTPTRDIEIKAGEDLEIKIDNIKCPTLTLNKLDSITRDGLSGVRFKIEFSATSGFVGAVEDLGEAVTDANGQIVLKHPQYKMAAGWYRLTEIAAKPGYNLANPASQTLHLAGGENKTMTFENVPKSALIIRKTDLDGKPVQGATFTVRYLGGTSGSGGTVIHTGVTSVNGTIVLTGLAAGTYVVEETKAAPGFELSNPSVQTAYISGLDQDVVELAFANPRMGKLIVTKLDSVTKKPLAGATFKVTDSSGGVIGPSNGIYTTDASGVITIEEDLPVGSTIVVTEQSAPDGYVLDGTPQTVKIKENTLHSLTFYNAPKSGLQIVKIDSVTKQPLKGAQFTVYKKSGDVLGTFETDGDGLIIIPELEPGWIKIVETKTPPGYVLDDTPKDVEIKTNEFHKIVFENVPMAGLQIIKLDEETRRPIAGVQFTLSKMNGERIGGVYTTDASGLIRIPSLDDGWYTVTETRAGKDYLIDTTPHNIEVVDGKTAALTITNRKASGIMIHKIDALTKSGIYGVKFLISDSNDKPVLTDTSDQNGYVYVNGLPDGKYYIREIEAATGYLIDTSVKTFYVRYGATEVITWENTPILGQIQIVKVSEDANTITGLPAGTLLAGAEFDIFNRFGVRVDTVRTDINGFAASKPLPLERYVIREVKAPPHYTKSDVDVNVELEYVGQIVRVTVSNKAVRLGVSLTKKGAVETMPGSTMKYSLENIANTSSVPLTSFYVRDILPTDAVRVQTLQLGRWSSATTYKVVYKTNQSNGEYIMLKDNLTTTQSYTLDMRATTLSLKAGEFVTEVSLMFGQVPAGFRSTSPIYITCAVLDGLPNAYEFANKADVGGMHGDRSVITTSRWLTKIYAPVKNTKLPRTGY